MDKLSLSFYPSMDSFTPQQWNALVAPGDNPALDFFWLHAMEASGSIVADHGWLPHHCAIFRGDRLVAAAPSYVRGHSWGDFVFDHMWANAARQMGFGYYPKLTATVPASPVPGYGLLVAPGEDRRTITALWLETMVQEAKSIGCHGFHLLFDQGDSTVTEHLGSPWKHQSYLWTNRNFRSFDDYTAEFSKNQRRNIKREYASKKEQGYRSEVIDGVEFDYRHGDEGWNLISDLYHKTNDQFGPYAARFLTRDFFQAIDPEYHSSIVLSVAYDLDSSPGDLPFAMAFMLRGHDNLVGRYWGTSEYRKNLHFNLCYYDPIAYAIDQGIGSFDPGMGSEHKVRRGFESTHYNSYHFHLSPEFRAIYEANIDRVNQYEDEVIDQLNAMVPKKTVV